MSGLRPETLGFIEMINPDFIEVNMGDWLVDYKSKSPELFNTIGLEFLTR